MMSLLVAVVQVADGLRLSSFVDSVEVLQIVNIMMDDFSTTQVFYNSTIYCVY